MDLDTIDLSNLNRQFLFRQKDIKQPKASTAVNAVQQFNFFRTKLIPYQSSIYDTDQFPVSWFAQFEIFFNALDNIPARSYINKLALLLNKPVMETGTTGTSGQAQPTLPHVTECYDCVVRDTPKTFPVCTIRSTPSLPVHCIHWAKSFLFTSLFSEDVEDEVQPDGKDIGALGAENKEEIENLIKENNELMELKLAMRGDGFAEKVIDKVFKADIEKLLLIEELWKARKSPIPLDFTSLEKLVHQVTKEELGTGQKCWTIIQNLKVFLDATANLQKRILTEKEIEFDKDDQDTLNFVAAAANIRSYIFHITLQSQFEIKSIAGNIIPAIATTNAVIAGFSALLSLKHFTDDAFKNSRCVFTANGVDKFVSPSFLQPPNPQCAACSVIRGVANLDGQTTVSELVELIQGKYGYDEELSLSLGSSLLYDVDFDDNGGKTLTQMGIIRGVTLSVADESDRLQSLELFVDSGETSLPDLTIPPKPEVKRPQESNEEDDFELVVDDDVVEVKRKVESPLEPESKRVKL